MSQDKNPLPPETICVRIPWRHRLACFGVLVSALQGSFSLTGAAVLLEHSPDPVQAGGDAQGAVRHNDNGLRFLREQRLEEAIAEFHQAIRADPKSPSSYN